MMNSAVLIITRFVGFLVTIYIWLVVQFGQFSQFTSLIIIIGGIVLVLPAVWIGRKAVDVKPTVERLAWTTTIVHMLLMVLLGASVIQAIKFFQVERGMTIPLPVEISMVLVVLTGIISLLTVANLALSGLGAPFAIALSKRIANQWMYCWTRNPMVLSTLAMLLSVGFYLQSLYFLLWVVLLVTPVLTYYLKTYEERELEIRFGAPYLDYKAKTSFLWPRRPAS
jgi:protein-S-isoprenylcysteine O-methyltransferase Ste14